jgi:hypothetical protein
MNNIQIEKCANCGHPVAYNDGILYHVSIDASGQMYSAICEETISPKELVGVMSQRFNNFEFEIRKVFGETFYLNRSSLRVYCTCKQPSIAKTSGEEGNRNVYFEGGNEDGR